VKVTNLPDFIVKRGQIRCHIFYTWERRSKSAVVWFAWSPYPRVCVRECGLLFGIGLCLFVGIIIYIGAVTGEASNRPKSGDEPKFTYTYGPSLAMTFISFISCELTAVLAVQLYISRHRRVKPAVAPSPSSVPPPAEDEVDSVCPLPTPSNGRAPRGFITDRLDASPRREALAPWNDRRPQSNCSSPSVVGFQQTCVKSSSLRRDAKSARSVASSFSGGHVISDNITRHRYHDFIGDYSSTDDCRRQDFLSASRACISLSNVRSVDDLDPFKRITPV